MSSATAPHAGAGRHPPAHERLDQQSAASLPGAPPGLGLLLAQGHTPVRKSACWGAPRLATGSAWWDPPGAAGLNWGAEGPAGGERGVARDGQRKPREDAGGADRTGAAHRKWGDRETGQSCGEPGGGNLGESAGRADPGTAFGGARQREEWERAQGGASPGGRHLLRTSCFRAIGAGA